jgi:hypothetical protein
MDSGRNDPRRWTRRRAADRVDATRDASRNREPASALSTIAIEVARVGARCAPSARSQLCRALNRTCGDTLAQSMQ